MPTFRIAEFDTWRPGYGLATVRVEVAGTTVLADIFTDEARTAAADNPVTLSERIIDDISYGRFPASLYTAQPYQLKINSIDETGIARPPLTSLDDEDASAATVQVTGGEEDVPLADMLARLIDVRDYGEFLAVGQPGASASTNNTTLTTAIGVAGAQEGGRVKLPSGTYAATSYSVPQGVTIEGQGRDATILQSTVAGAFATIAGERAGFREITLDGVTLVGNSIGVYAENKDQVVLDRVLVKRFETAVSRKGGSYSFWRNLLLSNCAIGYKGHGDNASAAGGAISFNRWHGGGVELCSQRGLSLVNIDEACEHESFVGLNFDTNTGEAVHIEGAQDISLVGCRFDGNDVNLAIDDTDDDNTVIGVEIVGGSINGGEINLTGNLETVAFRRVTMQDIDVTITTPGHNVLVEDCREVSGVSLAGISTAWMRRKTGDRGATGGITAGAAATKAWGITLDPGQRVFLEAKVVGRQRDGTNDGYYFIAVSARRPGASLAYDTQTVNFTAGNVLTGATSGATARITADTDAGATGTLTLQDVIGTFIDNEIISDSGGGSATANGALSFSDAALAGLVTAIRAAQETNASWDATFVANGPEIELRVTGANSQTVEWAVDVDVVSS